MATRIQIRRDTSANWTANNPTLEEGEIGYVTDAASDSVSLKIGDGTTAWNSLSYFVPDAGSSTWGSIGGTLSDQTDLQNALDGKQDDLSFDSSPTDGSSNPVTSNGVYDALATKQNSLGYTPENSANKGQASGYASLDSNTLIPIVQLPITPITSAPGATSGTITVAVTSELEITPITQSGILYFTITGTPPYKKKYIVDGYILIMTL
jgi:hypothetical protein